MSKPVQNLCTSFEECVKKFKSDNEINMKIFIKNLNEIPFIENESKKENFLKTVLRNINIFHYPSGIEKKNITLYINFGNAKEQEKFMKIMKLSGNLVFKEDLSGNNFSNQIYINKIKSIVPFLNYLLSLLHEQFNLINSENINPTNIDSPLIIFNKKIKTLLKDKKICTNATKDINIFVKGLGSEGFIIFPIKSMDIEISFKTCNGTYIYTCSKEQFRNLFSKENNEKKKGLDCKELVKWIEENKLNDNRTKFYLVPSQITIGKTDFVENNLVKKYKSEYENSDFFDKLEEYFNKQKSKNININLKYWLSIRMNINNKDIEYKSEYDNFMDDEDMEPETLEEKDYKINKLHKEFLKKFKHLIQEKNLTQIVKNEIFNHNENIKTAYNDEEIKVIETNLIEKLSIGNSTDSDLDDEDKSDKEEDSS